jgi:hypothetical protein
MFLLATNRSVGGNTSPICHFGIALSPDTLGFGCSLDGFSVDAR